MKAADIRADFQGDTPCYEPCDEGSVMNAQVKILAEIAAQLAEHNHIQECILIELQALRNR